MNLRDARKKKKIDAFMTEREQHRTENDASERFKALTEAMALGKPSAKPKAKRRTSRSGSSED
mgnify:FL=1